MLVRFFSVIVLTALPVLTSIVLVTEPASLADIGLCVVSWAATALFADHLFEWGFPGRNGAIRATPS